MSDADASERIRRLDARTVERIAAGEVVDRPASAVKELVENSLDADASRVSVELADGGKTRIRVHDDGEGMSAADARAAIRKHTTSKIRDIADLDAGVGTLGFRGEALYAIGAISKLTVTTRERGADGAGTELRVEGGEVADVGPAGCPEGTTMLVEDLFYNTPARRKYLGTDATEFAHANRIVSRYALANPDVAVSLSHDGRETFATTGRGNLRETILAVYGRDVARSMVEVDAVPDDAPLSRVGGYVSHPETTRSTREYLATFVNGRYVSEGSLRGAVLDAYGAQLAADRFPFAVLFLSVPPDRVDVNVHPRKLDVRFDDEAGVADAVRRAVADALLDAGLLRTKAPRGRSAPGDAAIRPDASVAESAGGPNARPAQGGGPGDEVPEAASGTDVGGDATGPGHTNAGQATPGRLSESKSEPGTTDDGPAAGRSGRASPAAKSTDSADRTDSRSPTDARTADTGSDVDAGPVSCSDGSRPSGRGDRKFRAETENARLPGVEPSERDDGTGFDRLPPLRVLGQIDDTYVVCESDGGLVLVDQHAADERVAYERLRERAAEGRDAQTLVRPVELELTAGEAAAFAECVEDLRDLGFEVHLDDRTARVTAVPAVFADALDPALVRDVLAGFVGGDRDRTSVVEDAAAALLADMACYPAVTGNTPLSEGRVLDLLAELDACENPWACPHGRPVVIEVSTAELADRFERDYPGHAVRRPEE